MTKDPVLVILQLTGGNDYLNTVIPYTDSLYWDNRKAVRIPEEQVIPLDERVGLHPSMAPLKRFWDEGKMAILHGIGYPNSTRSHFRSMDIWHTCEPDRVGIEGWGGRVVRELDPNKENVVTAVNFGQGLPRAMAVPGVPVASVSQLESYGVLTGIPQEEERMQALELFARIYSPAIGRGPVMDYLGQMGLDALKGADILKTAPLRYTSSVEYGATSLAQKMRGIAMVHTANVGTRVFYTQQGSYDTHGVQLKTHADLWQEASQAIADFLDDLKEHDEADNVMLFLFSEFGRRVRDNASGTDHGAGGVAFAIGDPVKGGHYSEYPSIQPGDLEEGDMAHTIDFRGVYASIIEQYLGLDPVPIVNGTFEQLSFVK